MTVTSAAARSGTASQGASLELVGLSSRFGSVVALDGLTFSVPPGQVFGFLGPNGAGKTTTMRAIFGVVALDAGEVRWQGEPLTEQARRRFGARARAGLTSLPTTPVFGESGRVDRQQWDERYSGDEFEWSMHPNQFVAAELTGVPPGRALDLAAGEGRNSVWLAEQGWSVTAVDFSRVGLEKGRKLSAVRGVATARWTGWSPT